MQNAALALQAYNNADTPTRSDRNTEYQAFARVTSALQSASESDPTDMPALAEAIFLNRRLWAILATDVAIAENGLPDGLKASIASLAIFVQRHSPSVLDGTGDADALIEVNTNIMRGLRGNTGDAS